MINYYKLLNINTIMNRCLCRNMFDKGGCKTFNCHYSHSKEDIEEKEVIYCFHNDGKFMIVSDRERNQYYMSWNIITKYLETHPVKLDDISKYTYKCYYDKKSKDERQNRYKIIYISEIFKITRYSGNLKIKKNIQRENLDDDLDTYTNKSKTSDELNQLKNFVNEISISHSKMYKEQSSLLNQLKTFVNDQNHIINKINNDNKKQEFKIHELEKEINQLKRNSETSKVKYNLRKRKKC